MGYREIICAFCRECKGELISQEIIRTTDKLNSDTIVTKCTNFCPKYNFGKSNTPEYCSFLVDMEDNFEQFED